MLKSKTPFPSILGEYPKLLVFLINLTLFIPFLFIFYKTNYNDIKVGDQLEIFEKVEVKVTL